MPRVGELVDIEGLNGGRRVTNRRSAHRSRIGPQKRKPVKQNAIKFVLFLFHGDHLRSIFALFRTNV